jgi:hypothetical protein
MFNYVAFANLPSPHLACILKLLPPHDRYGIDDERSKTEKRYSKMQNLGGSDFRAGGTSKQLHRYIVGINNGDKVCYICYFPHKL